MLGLWSKGSYFLLNTAVALANDGEIGPGASNPYVPWSPQKFVEGVAVLRQNVGVIIDVCFWSFLIITGIYLIIKLGNMIIG